MGVEIPVGYGQITYKFQCQGRADPACTTIGVANSLNYDASEIAEGANTALVGSGIVTAGNMSVGWTYLGCDVTYQSSSGPFIGAFSASVTGSLSGGAMPANCCFLVTKGTAVGGRRGKGRMYWPAIFANEAGVDQAGVVSGGTMSTVQPRLTTLLVNLGVTAGDPVLFHANGSTPTEITTLQLGTIIATQRRRIR